MDTEQQILLRPPSTSGRSARRWLRAALLLGVLPAGLAAAQPTVGVAVRIDSSTLLKRPLLSSAAVRADIAGRLATAARAQFGYLGWTVEPEGAPAAGARLVLRVYDGKAGLCDPPDVFVALVAERDGAAEPVSPAVRFAAACDFAWLDTTPEGLAAAVGETIAGAVRPGDGPGAPVTGLLTPETAVAIQTRLLSNIVLVRGLEPDLAGERLYLPLRPEELKASSKSEIEIRFGASQSDGKLEVRPQVFSGPRTQVYIKEFLCGSQISSGGPLPETDGAPWHPRVRELLDHCHDPAVFMLRYEPAPLAGRMQGDVLLDPHGGRP